MRKTATVKNLMEIKNQTMKVRTMMTRRRNTEQTANALNLQQKTAKS